MYSIDFIPSCFCKIYAWIVSENIIGTPFSWTRLISAVLRCKYVSATAIPNSHLICLSLGTKKSVSKSWTHAPGHQDTLYGTLKIASKYFLWNLRLLQDIEDTLYGTLSVHKWSKTRKCTSSDQKNLDSGVISYWKGNYIYDTSYCCRWFLKVWRWNLSRHPSWRVKTPKLLFDLK
jgi:hypothetical protein